METASFEQAEHGGGLFYAYQCFLVTVSVKPYFDFVCTELLCGDVAACHFSHDEFVIEKAVLGQPLGIGTHVFRY